MERLRLPTTRADRVRSEFFRGPLEVAQRALRSIGRGIYYQFSGNIPPPTREELTLRDEIQTSVVPLRQTPRIREQNLRERGDTNTRQTPRLRERFLRERGIDITEDEPPDIPTPTPTVPPLALMPPPVIEEAPDEYDLGDADQYVVAPDVAADLADGRPETRRAIALAAAAPKRKRRGEDAGIVLQMREEDLEALRRGDARVTRAVSKLRNVQKLRRSNRLKKKTGK